MIAVLWNNNRYMGGAVDVWATIPPVKITTEDYYYSSTSAFPKGAFTSANQSGSMGKFVNSGGPGWFRKIEITNIAGPNAAMSTLSNWSIQLVDSSGNVVNPHSAIGTAEYTIQLSSAATFSSPVTGTVRIYYVA